MNLRQKRTKSPEARSLSPIERAKQFAEEIESKIEQELGQSKITVSPRKKPFFNGQNFFQLEQARLKKIKANKWSIERKLNEIKDLQKQYKQDLQIKEAKDKRKRKMMRPKSELSIKDKKIIQEMQAKFEEDQREFERRALELQNKKYQLLKVEKSSKMKVMGEINDKKKLKIQKRLGELIEKREKRIQKHEEEKKIINQLKKQKKLHDEVFQNWTKREQQFEEKVKRDHKKKMNERDFQFFILKEHQKKYDDVMKNKREESKRKKEEFENFLAKSSTPKSLHSKYYTQAIEESEKSRIRNTEQKQMKREKLMKMWQYAEVVKSKYPPKLVVKTQAEAEDEENQFLVLREKERKALNPETVKFLGRSYLEYSKSKRNMQINPKSTLFSQKEENETPNFKRYNNYLRIGSTSARVTRNFKTEIKEARNVMKKTEFTSAQKVEQMKMIAHKIDAKGNQNKPHDLVSKISAKMHVLSALTDI